MLLFLLLFVAFCGYLILSRNSRMFHQLKIPYHKFNPRYPFFIERLYTIVKLGISNSEERFKIITKLCLQYSDMVKVWFGPQLVIFVNHPQRIQKVLLSPKCADKWNLFYVLMERETALTAGRTNLKWKEHRKFFNYCFTLPALESCVKIFAECSDNFCETLKRETKGSEFSFLPIAKKFSFDILCGTSLNMKAKDLFDETTYEKIFSAFETTEETFNHKTEIPFIYPGTVFKLTKLRRKEREAQQILNEFRNYIFQRRREIMKASESIDTSDVPCYGRHAMIDHIIRNEEKFTNKEILDHVLNFTAGYEILANAVAHTILLFAIHPEVQQKLFESINNSILSDEDVGNSKIIKGIEYLDLVLKETYRLMPTVPMILREVTDDFEIEPGLVIPKGVKLVISFCALHRRKDIWGSDCDDFKPERFSIENSDDRHIFSFLPFSGGSRICIGNKYSILMLKIATVQLIRKFKFSTSMTMKDIRLQSYVSLKLCTEHLVSLEPREKQTFTFRKQSENE